LYATIYVTHKALAVIKAIKARHANNRFITSPVAYPALSN